MFSIQGQTRRGTKYQIFLGLLFPFHYFDNVWMLRSLKNSIAVLLWIVSICAHVCLYLCFSKLSFVSMLRSLKNSILVSMWIISIWLNPNSDNNIYQPNIYVSVNIIIMFQCFVLWRKTILHSSRPISK